MVSGYLLRDVITKLNGIHFTASNELHTLGALYESMLRGCATRWRSGEFHTPRRRPLDGRRHGPASG